MEVYYNVYNISKSGIHFFLKIINQKLCQLWSPLLYSLFIIIWYNYMVYLRGSITLEG